jgi:hypothetical protein
MRRLFVVLVLLVVGVAVLGFYRGWFSVDWEKRADGKGEITGTVDQNKIDEDKKQAVERIKDLSSSSKASATDKSKDGK